MWEYKKVLIKYRSIIDINEQLNLYGKDGWEIIYYNEKENEISILLKKMKN
jgi:hypothetical protein